MAAKVKGVTIDKVYSGISSRDARRAVGRKKKADRLKAAQQKGGLGLPEGKDRDCRKNSDQRKNQTSLGSNDRRSKGRRQSG